MLLNLKKTIRRQYMKRNKSLVILTVISFFALSFLIKKETMAQSFIDRIDSQELAGVGWVCLCVVLGDGDNLDINKLHVRCKDVSDPENYNYAEVDVGFNSAYENTDCDYLSDNGNGKCKGKFVNIHDETLSVVTTCPNLNNNEAN